jgi:alkanesulfonate monooxygenase SsuD/methylene tetrahydromethanopterin reductase-like flavin-dependent oxidoreductase (luciferase family)
MIAGIGAGGEGWDAVMLGHPAWSQAERADRYGEFVTLLDLLLRQPTTDWTGRYYAADGARSAPGCVQQPRVPFAIAATGPRGMRLAAEHGALWVTTGDRKGDPVTGEPLAFGPGADYVRRQITRLDEACAAVGRDPKTIDRLVLLGPSLETGLQSVAAFEETKGAYADAGATDVVVPWPRAREPYAGDPAILDRIMA